MTVEIIGMVGTQDVSESRGDPGGPPLDVDYLTRFAQAAEREVHDERLWFGVTRLTGPGGNSSALVGTPEQVARALMRYREVGVDTVLIRGFDPLEDVVDWGRELIPRIRALAETIPAGDCGA